MRLYRFLSASFIIFFIFSHGVAAQNVKTLEAAEKTKKFPVSGFIAFSVNTMIAESREYVCHYDLILSDLKWPLTPSASYTVYGGLYFPKGIRIEGNISFMQPMPTGSMTDTDFKGIQVTPPQTGITEFSKHNSTIVDGLSWTAKLGLQLPMPQSATMRRTGTSLTVEPMLSFYYSAISWHSYDGYFQYAKRKPDGTYEPWNAALPKVPYTGAAASYQQRIMIPAIGVGFEATLPHKLTLSSDFHLTAGIKASAEDIHHSKNKNVRYVDIMDGGWGMHGNARLNWHCLPFFSVFFNFFYIYCITMEGRSAIYNDITSTIPDSYTPPNSAGTALYGCTCSIGLAFSVGR